MAKYAFAAMALLGILGVAAPALAQDAPARAEVKSNPGTLGGSGAASASYARCAPGSPIGGIVVKGGSNPTRRTAGGAEDCPAPEAAADEHRTYTGGRRNDDAPSAAAEANAVAPVSNMPSRLSMTPTTAKAVAPAQPAGKSISEKGVSSSKPR